MLAATSRASLSTRPSRSRRCRARMEGLDTAVVFKVRSDLLPHLQQLAVLSGDYPRTQR
jgi:hypothetical protein